MHSLALKENAFISFKGENPVVVKPNITNTEWLEISF